MPGLAVSLARSVMTNEKLFSQRDFDYETQMNRWLLTLIGIWPTPPNAGIVKKLQIASTICCCYFQICFLLVPCGLHTFLIEKDSASRLRMIGPLSFCLMAVTKFSLLVFHRKDICDCLEHIAEDWARVGTSGEREIMLKKAKLGRLVVTLSAGFVYGGSFFYHTIMPLSSGTIVTPANASLRPLTYPVYDPLFDARTSPNYEIVFVVQCFSGFVLITVTIGAFSIAAVFAMHACGQFEILVSRLKRLVDGDDGRRESADQRLVNIVELHVRTLCSVSRLESVLNEVCLVEIIGSTMNICLIGYYLMTAWEESEAIGILTFCVLLVSFIFNSLIFCCIGEKVKEQSEEIGTMTYMTDWYRLQSATSCGLLLILVMSKYPARLTAGRMADLSMNCFFNVLKSALTYLNLLRTMASPIYEIVLATQWLSAFVMYTITIGACSVAAVFAMHACSRFKVPVGRLNKLVHGDVEKCDSVDDRIADIVELHLRALRNGSKRRQSITYCVLLISFIFYIPIFCYIGDKLGEESEDIGTMAYMILGVQLSSVRFQKMALGAING